MRRVRSDLSARNGFTLVEFLVAMAIAGCLLAVALPGWTALRRKDSLRVATEELREIFHFARSRAIARSRSTGVVFTSDGRTWQYAIYDDGDGDGIRTDDIKKGVDRMVRGRREVLRAIGGSARIGMPERRVPDPDGGSLKLTASPVRFGTANICSFSPIGGATPGSIFLTWGGDGVAMVRVYGATAKIRAVRYLAAAGRWEN